MEQENNDIELYEKAKARTKNKIPEKIITDKDIVIEQEKEIGQYRNRIQQLIRINDNLHGLNMEMNTLTVKGQEESDIEQLIDYMTETVYEDGQIVKETSIYYK